MIQFEHFVVGGSPYSDTQGCWLHQTPPSTLIAQKKEEATLPSQQPLIIHLLFIMLHLRTLHPSNQRFFTPMEKQRINPFKEIVVCLPIWTNMHVDTNKLQKLTPPLLCSPHVLRKNKFEFQSISVLLTEVLVVRIEGNHAWCALTALANLVFLFQ